MVMWLSCIAEAAIRASHTGNVTLMAIIEMHRLMKTNNKHACALDASP